MALIDFLRYLLCERTGNNLGIWITDQSGTNSIDNLNRADVCFMDWLWLHDHPEHPYYAMVAGRTDPKHPLWGVRL